MTQQFHSLDYIGRKKTTSEGYLYLNVHRRIIYSCQDVEAT